MEQESSQNSIERNGIDDAISTKEPTRGYVDKSIYIANNVSAERLLRMRLVIPKYQRPYCWREENVKEFLNDIERWQMEKGKNGVNYHIGSVILKEQNSGDFDIVDGQQRLTTLAILAKLQDFSKEEDNISLLSQQKRCFSTEEIQTLLRARNVIKAFLDLETKKNDQDENASNIDKRTMENVPDTMMSKIFLSKVVFSVVVIGSCQPEDLAYTFFSNNNSTGKPLTDYDLLKTHHLRYVSNDNVANILSEKWHDIEKIGIMNDLLQNMLFRLRNWRNQNSFAFESASKDRHDVFKHFKSVDPLPDFVNYSFCQFRFDSLMSGGEDFFTYVNYYGKKYQEFNKLEVINELVSRLGWYSNGVICAGIKAASFLFYCKFGDIYIKEAVYLLAYRLSKLRNESQIRCDYLGGQTEKTSKKCSDFRETVQMIDQAVSEAQLFAWLYDVKKRYPITNVGNGNLNSAVTGYWHALKKLMEDISKKETFNSSVKISISIPQNTKKEG